MATITADTQKQTVPGEIRRQRAWCLRREAENNDRKAGEKDVDAKISARSANWTRFKSGWRDKDSYPFPNDDKSSADYRSDARNYRRRIGYAVDAAAEFRAKASGQRFGAMVQDVLAFVEIGFAKAGFRPRWLVPSS